jgi:hypothetical protein
MDVGMTDPARKRPPTPPVLQRSYRYSDAIKYIGAGKSFFDVHIKWRVKWHKAGTHSLAERTDLDYAYDAYLADKAAGRLQKRRKQVEWTKDGEAKRLDFIATGRPGRGRSTRSGRVLGFEEASARILARQRASSSTESTS